MAFFEMQTIHEPNHKVAAVKLAKDLISIIDNRATSMGFTLELRTQDGRVSALCDKLGKNRPL